MNNKEKILMCWSGGKDSAFALYEILNSNQYEVLSLLTTLTEPYDRISMHGVRRVLLDKQAESLALPLHKIYISRNSSNQEYETKMEEALSFYKKQGVDTVAFGDIFLEDLRTYREKNLARIGMRGLFPIWKRDTQELAHSFISLGFKAVLSCIDPKVLDPSFVGRVFDDELLHDFPANIDPCGENGEFHSFVYQCPIFKKEIPLQIGEKTLRDGFWFCDLIPKSEKFSLV